MKQSRRRRDERKGERGAALAVVGICMLMLVGMAVVGVDIGRLALTANEVQALADLSATSYMKSLALNQDDGGARDPVAETSVVVEQNSVAGSGATIDDNIESFEEGHFNTETQTFQPGGMPVNAVRATAVATVSNVFASIYGDNESTVRRRATAAITPPRRAPVLPLAIGECFWDIFGNTGDCAALPHFELVPETTDNSCWTSLLDGSANKDTIADMIRVYCGLDSGAPPTVSQGDDITLINGKVTPLLRAVQDCLDAGVNDFVVPVIPCNQCNQTSEVQGFAKIHVTGVVTNGRADSTGIYADSVCSTNPPGALGGGSGPPAGATVITMVE